MPAAPVPSFDYLASIGFAPPFMALLKTYGAAVCAADTWAMTPAEIVGAHPSREAVQGTRFLNAGEGYLFGGLMHMALSLPQAQNIETMLDLGTGSALPPLRVVWERLQKNQPLTLTGVDIDAEAVVIAQRNAEALGIEACTDFVCADMFAYLRGYTPPHHLVVAANPPYIPVPETLEDPFFIPIQAGADGLKFITPILQKEWRPGTLLCLFASSLTSPAQLMEEIGRDYHVLQLSAHLRPFGRYVNDERVLPYLERLRDSGAIAFGRDDTQRYFVSLGFVLQKK